MIDCGEGTQLAWRGTRLNWQRLTHIFITHAHGDHVFGLPGLISSMALMGRKAPLIIHGPAQLRPFLQCVLANFCQGMDYQVEFVTVDTTEHKRVYVDRSMEVWSLPLKHRVPCCGYLIKEAPIADHIRREMIDFYKVPLQAIKAIKAGGDWTTPDGQVVPHERLTTPAEPARSYAYCSDTMPVPEVAEWCQGVDLLYHEATFADVHQQRAQEVGHSTAREAAMVAKASNAKRLLLGHFSARYPDEEMLLREAQEVFPNTILAAEGLCITP